MTITEKLVNAIENVTSGSSKAVEIDDCLWFKVFNNPEEKRNNIVDIVLMNKCAATPFMFFADAKDKNLSSSVEKNASRIYKEYSDALIIDKEDPEPEF